MKWFFVFVGSGLGGCFRLLTAEIAARYFSRAFPFGTLAANLLACLILGFVLAYFDQAKMLDTRMRLFLGVGICGGFSTFSTFSNETLQFFAEQKFMEGTIYAGGSLVFGLIAIYLGFTFASVLK